MVRTTSCVHCVRRGWRAAALKENACLGQMPEIGEGGGRLLVEIGSCCVKVEGGSPGACGKRVDRRRAAYTREHYLAIKKSEASRWAGPRACAQ